MGSLMICVTAADAADVMVVTRKTWMTRKMKYQFCTLSSMLGRDGSPDSRTSPVQSGQQPQPAGGHAAGHIHPKILGTHSSRSESNSGGSRPVMAPTMKGGSRLRTCRNGTFSDR